MSAPAINRLAIFLKSSQLCFVSDGSQVSFIPSALPTDSTPQLCAIFRGCGFSSGLLDAFAAGCRLCCPLSPGFVGEIDSKQKNDSSQLLQAHRVRSQPPLHP